MLTMAKLQCFWAGLRTPGRRETWACEKTARGEKIAILEKRARANTKKQT